MSDSIFSPFIQVEEGSSLLINLTARANPAQIEYKWSNPDRLSVPEAADALPGTRITAVGGVLNVTAARKDDAGRYRLKAANAEGKASIKVRLDVQYQPRQVKDSETDGTSTRYPS